MGTEFGGDTLTPEHAGCDAATCRFRPNFRCAQPGSPGNPITSQGQYGWFPQGGIPGPNGTVLHDASGLVEFWGGVSNGSYYDRMQCWCTTSSGFYSSTQFDWPGGACTPKACQFPARCVDATQAKGNGTTCVTGTEGDGCVLCSLGYYRFQSACKVCPKNKTQTILVIVFLGVFILYLGPIITELTSPTVRASLKNLLSHLQFLSINLNLGLHWPPVFSKLFDRLRQLMDGIQLAAPECVSVGYTYDLYVGILMYTFVAVGGAFLLGIYLLDMLRKNLRIHGVTQHPGVDTSPLATRLAKLQLPLGWWIQRTGLWAKMSTTLFLTSGMLYPIDYILKHGAALRALYRMPALPEGVAEDEASLSELALNRAYELYVGWWRSAIGLKQFSVLLLGLAYTYILTVTTLDVDCFIDARGVSRLVRDSRVVCDTAAHQRSSTVAIAVAAIVGFGVPASFVLMISRLRRVTRQREPLVTRTGGNSAEPGEATEEVLDLLEWRGLRDPETLVSWGGMYEAYQNECVDPFIMVEAQCELRSAATRGAKQQLQQHRHRAGDAFRSLFGGDGTTPRKKSRQPSAGDHHDPTPHAGPALGLPSSPGADSPPASPASKGVAPPDQARMSLTGAHERTGAGLTSLTLHWYSIWLIGYHGERNAMPAVTQMASQMVAWREGAAPPPDVATVPVPPISHPVFIAWWPRLKLWVLVTRYIIRVRLSWCVCACVLPQLCFLPSHPPPPPPLRPATTRPSSSSRRRSSCCSAPPAGWVAAPRRAALWPSTPSSPSSASGCPPTAPWRSASQCPTPSSASSCSLSSSKSRAGCCLRSRGKKLMRARTPSGRASPRAPGSPGASTTGTPSS